MIFIQYSRPLPSTPWHLPSSIQWTSFIHDLITGYINDTVIALRTPQRAAHTHLFLLANSYVLVVVSVSVLSQCLALIHSLCFESHSTAALLASHTSTSTCSYLDSPARLFVCRLSSSASVMNSTLHFAYSLERAGSRWFSSFFSRFVSHLTSPSLQTFYFLL